jgi:hypothetical protein
VVWRVENRHAASYRSFTRNRIYPGRLWFSWAALLYAEKILRTLLGGEMSRDSWDRMSWRRLRTEVRSWVLDQSSTASALAARHYRNVWAPSSWTLFMLLGSMEACDHRLNSPPQCFWVSGCPHALCNFAKKRRRYSGVQRGMLYGTEGRMPDRVSDSISLQKLIFLYNKDIETIIR